MLFVVPPFRYKRTPNSQKQEKDQVEDHYIIVVEMFGTPVSGPPRFPLQDDHWGEHNQQDRATKDSLAAATAASSASPTKANGGNNGEVIFDDKNGFNVNVANKLNLSGRKGGEDNGGGGGKKEKRHIVSSN